MSQLALSLRAYLGGKVTTLKENVGNLYGKSVETFKANPCSTAFTVVAAITAIALFAASCALSGGIVLAVVAAFFATRVILIQRAKSADKTTDETTDTTSVVSDVSKSTTSNLDCISALEKIASNCLKRFFGRDNTTTHNPHSAA